jgi:hypothetical protein
MAVWPAGLVGVEAAVGGSLVDLRALELLGWMLITIALGARYFARSR